MTKQWQYTQPTQGEVIRVTHRLVGDVTNYSSRTYLKGVISPSIAEDIPLIFNPQLLTYREDIEIFNFVFPRGIGEQRIGFKRLDDSPFGWNISIDYLNPSPEDSLKNYLASRFGDFEELLTLGDDENMIIASENQPLTKKTGMIWVVLNSQNNETERWIWTGERWESYLQVFSSEHSGGATNWRYLPLNPNCDYQIYKWEYWIRSQRPHNGNEYIIPRLSIWNGMTESILFTASEPPLMPSEGQSKNYLEVPNLLIQTTPNDTRSLGVGTVRNNNINYAAGSNLYYRLIRK